jgi:hypothetical protein
MNNEVYVADDLKVTGDNVPYGYVKAGSFFELIFKNNVSLRIM